MTSKKIQDLNREIEKIKNMLKDLGVIEGVLEKEVKTFGNGGHIVLSKNYLNKKVRVIV